MEAARNLVSPKENNSNFFKSNESDSFIDDGRTHTNLLRIIPYKDPNNIFHRNPHGKSEIPSNPTIDYIRRYLLEEDVEEEISGCQEAALRDIEKPFYDILDENYPPSQDKQLLSSRSKENTNFTICIPKDPVSPSFDASLKQQSSIENLFATEFRRGVEEGMKFVPDLKNLSVDLQVRKLSWVPMEKCHTNFGLGEEKESGLLNRCKGKKSSDDTDLYLLEGRNHKISMLSFEETIRDEIFDKVLLTPGEKQARKKTSSLKKIMELKANYCSKYQSQDEHVNLRALLIACAEAISRNDIKIASELIKQIRKHASPIGDGIQSLACVFVDGLEARLAGFGSPIYRQLVTRRISATDFLKLYEVCCRVTYHFANKNILIAAGTASKIHIIDFGIGFGFQWPSVIQALARMKDGPPKLRITGVDLPQPGFHPAERIKVTGKRLEDYARDFGAPFEYHGIASQWESISIEDFCINDDEVLIVNSMSNISRLRDELLLGMSKSRNQYLNLIRVIKPKVFIQGIFNLSFSPYFIQRFRIVLLQYTRFFDMLDTLVPRNSKQRQIMETELFGPAIINLIACEGSDLVLKPETYKQCRMRNLEAGFEQLPVDPSVVKECSEIIRNCYHEENYIEEDCNWFLQGWKGNISYAISLWKPRVE